MARPVGKKDEVREEIMDILDAAQYNCIKARVTHTINSKARSEPPSLAEYVKITKMVETQFEKTLYAKLIGSVRVAIEGDKLTYEQMKAIKEKLRK